jgi:DNA primase
MRMAIREDIKDRVQQATDLVRLIGEQVALRPKGKEFAGLCPFHDDKNPSMQVSPAKQIYKCFSCGAGGDAFSFVMNYHKMNFPEAIKHLAERAGIEVEEENRWSGPGDSERVSERKLIAGANAQAMEFFRALLKHQEHGQIAREYIERRGISPEMVADFQIGYAPDGWDGLVQMIQHKGWDQSGFEYAGLVSKRDSGGYYDRLRHRLIFPIFDAIGRPIAFGGRKIREEDEPKYLNSPETKLFNKSATLYGLHLAKKPIIDSKTAVVVEGYTDVIGCHQGGARNVVATLGTALTSEHVRELRRYAEKVVLIFDPDEAGQKAADRAVELFLTGDMDVAIAVLPDGLDPADLMALEDGPKRWGEAVESAVDAMSYQFDRLNEQMDGTTTLTGQQKLADAYLTRLAQLGLARVGGIRRALIVQRLAGILHMSEQAVSDLLTRKTAAAKRSPRTAAGAAPGTASGVVSGPIYTDMPPSEDGQGTVPPEYEEYVPNEVASADSRRRLKALELAERQVIGCLVRDNQRFGQALCDGRTFDEAVSTADFVTTENRGLFQRVSDRLNEGDAITLAGLLGDLASEGEQGLSDILTQADADVDAATAGQSDQVGPVLGLAAQALLDHHREAQYREHKQSLASGGDDDAGGLDSAQLLRRMIEHRRDNPSPVRIARVGK